MTFVILGIGFGLERYYASYYRQHTDKKKAFLSYYPQQRRSQITVQILSIKDFHKSNFILELLIRTPRFSVSKKNVDVIPYKDTHKTDFLAFSTRRW